MTSEPLQPPKSPITRWLSRANDAQFSAYAIIASFATYFCMYAFRKPFTAAEFEGDTLALGALVMDYKIVLIIAQTLGYMCSKFIGIKVISEISGRRRGMAILLCIVVAEGALGLFAVTPAPWNVLFLFANGLPLGMVWGLVFGFLEGRRISEVLGAGLSASYIVASGAVKSVGRVVLGWGVSEEAMPFVVGLLFFPGLLVFVWCLTKLPPPSPADEAERTTRAPMNRAARRRFLRSFWPGLLALTVLYFFLTAYRSFRDDFAVEIWSALGYGETPEILSLSEIPVAFGVLIALALLFKIRDNRRALIVVHLFMAAGTGLVGVLTLLFEAGLVSNVVWMVGVGVGLYLAYVPFGCVLFDRLIAAVGFVATAVFMIYVTDAVGYLGSVGIMLYKNFGAPDLSWLDFFIDFSYVTSVLCTGCFLLALLYFIGKTRRRAPPRVGEPVAPVAP